jgi:muconolactone delta-isomerase
MRFMVESTSTHALTDDLLALVPAETARGQELDAQGLRHAFYLAADWSRSWQIFEADSVEEVHRALASLPLAQVTHNTITPLAEQP